MNKILILITIVLISLTVSMSVSVYAYNKISVVAETNDGTWVQTFTDNGNRCYVLERHTSSLYPITNTSDSNALAISCVKE